MTDHGAIALAIVTPTWNRASLLPRLHASLVRQGDHDFTWIIVDDASTDDTTSVIEDLAAASPFPVEVISQSDNRGKAAALNRAFAQPVGEFLLVVDSDEELHDDAVARVRESVDSLSGEASVGGIFFRYVGSDGELIGPTLPSSPQIMSRAENDAQWGKYDGAVGYFRRSVSKYTYPEFPGETYVGPTVLQLLMIPEFEFAFTNDVIAVAEYQSDGLTAGGRSLRIRNPQGMMAYCQLQQKTSPQLRTRVKYRLMYHAYADLAGTRTTRLREVPMALGGRVIARLWRSRAS